jgi:hypothetical protein
VLIEIKKIEVENEELKNKVNEKKGQTLPSGQ